MKHRRLDAARKAASAGFQRPNSEPVNVFKIGLTALQNDDVDAAIKSASRLFILWLPRQIFALLVDLVELMMSWLPEIEIVDVQPIFDGLGGQLLYFLTVFEFDYGLTAIFTALIARFILRRIPFIG